MGRLLLVDLHPEHPWPWEGCSQGAEASMSKHDQEADFLRGVLSTFAELVSLPLGAQEGQQAGGYGPQSMDTRVTAYPWSGGRS